MEPTEYTVTYKWLTRRRDNDVTLLAKEFVPRDLRARHGVDNWLVSITREEVVTKTVEVFPNVSG